MAEASTNERGGFIGELWHSIKSIYDEILVHPFLRDLTNGTLAEERFRFYVLQVVQAHIKKTSALK